MAATREDIQRWFERGVAEGYTHMIVVCDQYDYDDYPVYVSSNEDAHERYKEYDEKNMQYVMEVYNLKKDMNAQLNQGRAWNF